MSYTRAIVLNACGGDLKIGFIGAGKVGVSLGKYLKDHHCNLTGYYSKTLESAKEAATFTQSTCFESKLALIEKSDIIFVTVNDNSISSVLLDIPTKYLENKILCHCSGVLTAKEAFSALNCQNTSIYSLHPLCAVSSKTQSYKTFDKIAFFMEGSQSRFFEFEDFLKAAGLKVYRIKAELKKQYHLAASIVSNQVVAVCSKGIKVFKALGFDDKTALEALSPLMAFNMDNIVKQGCVGALTGPVQRGDKQTIEKHLSCIDERQDRLLYCLLSKELVTLAKQKDPTKDFNQIDDLLNKEIKEST